MFVTLVPVCMKDVVQSSLVTSVVCVHLCLKETCVKVSMSQKFFDREAPPPHKEQMNYEGTVLIEI